jgi:hypothetical protein
VIIPTPEYDPMYAADGVPFRVKMIRYIEREFGDILRGPRQLLHTDRGLEALAAITVSQLRGDAASNAA